MHTKKNCNLEPTHTYMLQVTNEWFLVAGTTFRVDLASESHWM